MNCPLQSPRWRKLGRDVRIEKERVLLMFTALVTSLIAIGIVFGSWQILTREIRASYLGTNPAQATLEIPGGVDQQLIEAVQSRPEVASAEAGDVLQARAKVGEEWRPLLVFVRSSSAVPKIGRFEFESSTPSAPDGELLLERTSVSGLGMGAARNLVVRFPHAPVIAIPISGLVHDPGLSPANQERSGYAYVTANTLRRLGEDPVLHELRVVFRSPHPTTAKVELLAGALASELGVRGIVVSEIRVPASEKHPHQAQMETILLLLLAFAALAFFLSAVLVATTLSAWLSRQTRELAILKTVGASSWQIASLYLALVALLGAAAFAIAWPLSWWGSGVFASQIATLLNFSIQSRSLDWTHPVVLGWAAIVVPVLVASFPITSASRTTVRQALADWGATAPSAWISRLPPVLRRTTRRPRRLALSLGLLAFSGAIFLAALCVRQGWLANLDKIWQTRHYDIEVRFQEPQNDSILHQLAKTPGVLAVETWGWTPASLARPGQIDLLHVWPDKGHGSFSVMGMPPATNLVSFPLLGGRKLRNSDSNATVFNHIAWAQAGRPPVGSWISLSVDGHSLRATLVGVVEEVGSPAIAYVTPEQFATKFATTGRSRLIRVVTSARDPAGRTAILHRLEQALERANLPIQVAVPFSELRTAIGDHIKVLVGALLALAGVIGLVGMLGLTSITGMGVLERTREFGVLKTLGGTPRQIVTLVLAENVVVAMLSWALGTALAIPLTLGLDTFIGRLGFLAPLPLVFPIHYVLGWLVLVLVVSLLSSWIPARRAASTSIREALAQP